MRRHWSPVTIGTLFALLAWAPAAVADPFPVKALPPDLVPWIPWVLDDVPDAPCVQQGEGAICAWPGTLTLALDDGGGRFEQAVLADRALWFPLPGDAAHWPQDVTVDGRPAVVLELDGRPAVRVEAGPARLAGRLVWGAVPEGIRVPPRTALVTLRLNGREVPFPRRDEDGLLWLQSAAAGDEESERLDLEVYRRVADGIPLLVETKVVVRAAGKAREVDLGRALVPGTVPLKVTADIPARVDKDGRLRVQVRAGTHHIEVLARVEGSPEALAPPPPGEAGPGAWPEDEIWVWQADEKLRQVTLGGAPGIDPGRTNLPAEWTALPAFLLRPGGALSLATTRRGEPEPPPDQLHLSRELWMDLDGGGFTARDRLRGELSRTWRLDLAAEGELGHVAVDGTDQLITTGTRDARPGVELRQGALRMSAEWRVEGASRTLPAVAWSENVQSLEATLHLPPGWTLITARGVDELPGTWWDEWDLFAFFFVLLVALAIGRLTRWWYGLIALTALILLHQKPDLPFGLWVFLWVNLLVFLGLLAVLPRGKLSLVARICCWVSVVFLVLATVPFMVSQIRTGLYPQIDEEYSGGMVTFGMNDMAFEAKAPAMIAEETMAMDERNVADELSELAAGSGEGYVSSKLEAKADVAQRQAASNELDGLLRSGRSDGWSKGGKKAPKRASLQQDPKAVVQTGPGVPEWSWRSWRLGWSGPVDRDHEIRLYLFSPGVNLALSLLRVALLLLLVIRVVVEVLRRSRPAPAPPEHPAPAVPAPATPGAAVAGGAAILLLAALVPLPATAEVPGPDVLGELRDRLTRAPECGSECVGTALLEISATPAGLRLAAEVHSGDDATWRVPGPARNWVPAAISVDGRPTSGIALLEDGFLHVRLPPGRHRVEALGSLPAGDAVTLELGAPPRRVAVDAPGFVVDGLRPDGRAESSIQLTRMVERGGDEGASAAANADESSYPPWLEVTRTLDLGIPWLVHTRVRRVSPTGSPVMLKVPLLEGESVTESEIQVEDGAAVLALGRDDTEAAWSSTLAERDRIELRAPEGRPWTEQWILRCSPVWSCAQEGLPPVEHKVDGRYEPTFRPWPGEGISVATRRPAGTDGQSVTVDSARLRVVPGVRLVTAELSLQVRSSRGGSQGIDLPEKAAIQELTVDGAKQPFRQDGRRVEVTLRPGSQLIVLSWQQPGGITGAFRVPEVKLAGPAANITCTVELPGDRWLIFADGPSWGPAVLFWGFLLSILVGGLVLGFVPHSPLKAWQWMLLALGLTQVHVVVTLIIVSWFFILAWRRFKPPSNFVIHNMLQIFVAVWTLVTLGCLVAAVYTGLAVQPDMQVAGAGSTNTSLTWYVDRIDGALPTPALYSTPILVWKLVMLAWALWLAWSLVQWARWGWKAVSHETLWRPYPAPAPLPPRASAPPQAPLPPAVPPEKD
jgi:hypothetical protein